MITQWNTELKPTESNERTVVHKYLKIVWISLVYLGDGRQGEQPAQWAELPGQEKGPVEGAGQAAGGWAWLQRSLGAGSGARQHDSDLLYKHKKNKNILLNKCALYHKACK